MIKYNAGEGWQETAMYDDGNHNDENAGDDIFGGSIPGFNEGTYVSYYLEAIDEDETSSYYPVNAPDILLEYENGWQHPQILINEYMASNNTTITDPQGDYEDWIELYNAGEEPVDLGGWYFTDDFDNLTGWFQISQNSPDSTMIAPGEFLLLWADEDTDDGIHHLGFKLSANGEDFGFFRYYGTTPVDTIGYNEMQEDVSWGRLPDGSTNWLLFGIGQEYPSTPGYTNQPSEIAPDQILPPSGTINAIYPNPFSYNGNRSAVSVELYCQKSKDTHLAVYNIRGQKVSSQTFQNLKSGNNTVSFILPDNLSTGVYFMRTIEDSDAVLSKFIIVK